MVVTSGEVEAEQNQLQALQKLDEQCVQYQLQGNYVAALECMERALVLRRHFFGLDSPEVRESCKAVAEMCNLLSMTFLQQENYTIAMELLKKAEVLTEQHPDGRATTLNNMACYYRRIGKLHGALSCLKRALAIELQLNKLQTTADTHLNLCAVYSTMGKHSEAIEHAQSGLILLQEELFSAGKDLSPLNVNKDRVSVLCIAYHNLGVEYEYLKQFTQCVHSYQKGVGIAEQYLGATHGVTVTLTNSYVAARRTVLTKAKKEDTQKSPKKKTSTSPVRLKQLEELSPTKLPSNLITSPRSNHRTDQPSLDCARSPARTTSPHLPPLTSLKQIPVEEEQLIRHHTLQPLRLPSLKFESEAKPPPDVSSTASVGGDEEIDRKVDSIDVAIENITSKSNDAQTIGEMKEDIKLQEGTKAEKLISEKEIANGHEGGDHCVPKEATESSKATQLAEETRRTVVESSTSEDKSIELQLPSIELKKSQSEQEGNAQLPPLTELHTQDKSASGVDTLEIATGIVKRLLNEASEIHNAMVQESAAIEVGEEMETNNPKPVEPHEESIKAPQVDKKEEVNEDHRKSGNDDTSGVVMSANEVRRADNERKELSNDTVAAPKNGTSNEDAVASTIIETKGISTEENTADQCEEDVKQTPKIEEQKDGIELNGKNDEPLEGNTSLLGDTNNVIDASQHELATNEETTITEENTFEKDLANAKSSSNSVESHICAEISISQEKDNKKILDEELAVNTMSRENEEIHFESDQGVEESIQDVEIDEKNEGKPIDPLGVKSITLEKEQSFRVATSHEENVKQIESLQEDSIPATELTRKESVESAEKIAEVNSIPNEPTPVGGLATSGETQNDFMVTSEAALEIGRELAENIQESGSVAEDKEEASANMTVNDVKEEYEKSSEGSIAELSNTDTLAKDVGSSSDEPAQAVCLKGVVDTDVADVAEIIKPITPILEHETSQVTSEETINSALKGEIQVPSPNSIEDAVVPGHILPVEKLSNDVEIINAAPLNPPDNHVNTQMDTSKPLETSETSDPQLQTLGEKQSLE